MLRKKSLEDLTSRIINLKPSEITLRFGRKINGEFDESKCVVKHLLRCTFPTDQKDKQFDYLFEHSFLIRNLNPKRLARSLHEDLSRILDEGKKLKSRGINLKLYFDEIGLSYLGQTEYMLSEGLDLLSIPMLMIDLKRYHKLK